jgi:hypothetical protein
MALMRTFQDGQLISETEIPDPPRSPLIHPNTFQRRFTDDELRAIQISTDANVIRGRTEVQTITSHVDLTDPLTQMFVGYLAQAGLIAPERVAELLTP